MSGCLLIAASFLTNSKLSKQSPVNPSVMYPPCARLYIVTSYLCAVTSQQRPLTS